jgi:hypothetical protein
MCAAEGACCGAVPVLFDTPTYRKWYAGIGLFIPEDGPTETTLALQKLFSSDVPRLTPVEIMRARERFDWANIVPPFWKNVINKNVWVPHTFAERFPNPTPAQQQLCDERTHPFRVATELRIGRVHVCIENIHSFGRL